MFSCIPAQKVISSLRTCGTLRFATDTRNVRHHFMIISDPVRQAKSYDLTSVYEEEEDPTNRSFFSEIISSISDVKFSHDGRYILARDYLSLRIWDVNMESRPLKTIQIHDHLRGKLCDLYENDCIFDKFECTWSGDDKWVPLLVTPILPNQTLSRNVLTGSYHNYLRIFDVDTLNDVVLQADKSAFKAKKIGGPLQGNKPLGAKNGIKPGLKDAMQLEPLDFNKKILHASWHPRENTIAVCVLLLARDAATLNLRHLQIAATNNLFLYSAA